MKRVLFSSSKTAGPSTTLRFGRDDNSVAAWALSGEILDLKRICHPDRSEPGFPAAWHSPTTTFAVPARRDRMKFDDATNVDRKSGGSGVEGPAVPLGRKGFLFPFEHGFTD
jgi:hypothetical protein